MVAASVHGRAEGAEDEGGALVAYTWVVGYVQVAEGLVPAGRNVELGLGF